MAIRDLILFLEAGSPPGARLTLAVALAERYGAALTTLFTPLEPVGVLADCYAIGPAAIADVLERRDAELAESLAAMQAALAVAIAKCSITHIEILAAAGESPQDLALRARCHDLTILRRPIAHDHASHALAEAVALGSGTPCILVPDEPTPDTSLERIAVGWNRAREAKRAVQDAMPLLQRACSVWLVAVAGESGETPGSLERDEVVRYLAQHGVACRVDRVDAQGEDAGSALLHHCAAVQADLLVMGAYGHSRTKELILGGATRTVLTQAPLPVFLSH